MGVLETAGVGVGGAIFMAMVFLIAAVICLYDALMQNEEVRND